MNDTTTMPIEVAESVVSTQVKAQLRIVLAMLAGAIAGTTFGHRFLPTGMFSDTLLDAIAALIFYGVAAGWQWVRARLVHSRFWALATNPDVPDRIIAPK